MVAPRVRAGLAGARGPIRLRHHFGHRLRGGAVPGVEVSLDLAVRTRRRDHSARQTLRGGENFRTCAERDILSCSPLRPGSGRKRRTPGTAPTTQSSLEVHPVARTLRQNHRRAFCGCLKGPTRSYRSRLELWFGGRVPAGPTTGSFTHRQDTSSTAYRRFGDTGGATRTRFCPLWMVDHRPPCAGARASADSTRSPEAPISVPVLLPPAVSAPRTLTDIYGPGVAVCARPALEADRAVGRHRHTRDVLSARPLAVAADSPVLSSAGGTEPNLLARSATAACRSAPTCASSAPRPSSPPASPKPSATAC